MDLLLSYQCGRYGRARREILRVLQHLGDEHPLIGRTAVDGIALVRSALDARVVAQGCRASFKRGLAFENAVKWAPVDYWCEADLEAIRRLLAEQVRGRIEPNETWGLKVAKRRWQRYHTDDIIRQLAGAIEE